VSPGEVVAAEHHRGQVGFFRAVARALEDPAVVALDATLDATWAADRDYVIADMNGSAVFLFSVLKMRLAVAVRRRRAIEEGRPPPTAGGPDAADQAALGPVLAIWFDAMGLPPTPRSTRARAPPARSFRIA